MRALAITTALVAGLATPALLNAAAFAAEPGAPTTPTAVSARAGVNSAKVYWAPPADAGTSPVTSYTVTSSPEGKTCTGGASATSCYVSALTNGQAYTFTVVANNAIGPSDAATTNAVTPRTDTAAPVLVSSEVTPDRASSLTSTSVTVRLRITDDVSGIRTPSGGLDANPAISFVKRTPEYTSFGFTRAVTRISGDEYDGIYQATTTVPAGTAAGTWELSVYPIDDKAGNSTSFISRPGILVGAPSAPTAVTATATAGRNVDVSWAAPSDNGGNAITGYRLTDSHTNTTRDVAGTSWTGSFAGIDATEQLTFTVVAVNAAGTSSPSAPTAAITVPAAAPSSPRTVNATRGNQSATITWATPEATNGAPVTGYTVTTLPAGPSVEAGADATTATVEGLTNGTTYTFAVTAENSGGSSAPANTNAVTPANAPGAPTQVTATAGDRAATVTWQASPGNGDPVSQYKVTAAPGGQSATVAGTATTANVAGLLNGTAYTFTVVATNQVGQGANSSPSTAVTPAAAPLAVSGVTAVRGDSEATITWAEASANGSPVTGYVVTYNGTTQDLGPEARTTTLTGLTNGTAYQVTVAAINALGTGAASTPVSVTPAARPSAPTGVSAVRGDQTATVSWSPAAGNGAPITGYTVAYNGSSVTVPAGARSATLTGLTNGTTYQVTVTATNAAGTSAASAAASVTPAGAPGKVAKPKVKVKGRNVTLTWKAPTANGATITSYTITGAKPAKKTVSGTTTKLVMKKLKPGKYKIRIAATNEIGTSAASAVATAKIRR